MKKKKILSILLAASVSLGLLSGCGDKEKESSNVGLTKDVKAKLKSYNFV